MGMIGREDGIFGQSMPRLRELRLDGPCHTNGERIGFVPLLGPAEVGHPILAVERLQF